MIFFICIALLFSFQPSFAANQKPLLKKGMSGDSVISLQRDLKKLGFFNPNPSGFFGDLTVQSVVKFQKKYGLSSDGKVGTSTYNKIDTLLKRSNPIKIIVDPGHGGADTGTLRGNLEESEVALSISKKLKYYLENDNYNVSLTRSGDYSLSGSATSGGTLEERDLSGRTNIINKSGAKFFVSIHVNSYLGVPSTSGSIVYYNSSIPKSVTLARNIQAALNAMVINGKGRQAHNVQTANYYILRNSKLPGVLVETAFITNPAEYKLLSQDDFRNKVAKAILSGIENTK